LKKDCDPEEIEIIGYVEEGRILNCSPDPSVKESAQDLEGFSQDSSFEEVSVVMDFVTFMVVTLM